MKDFLKRSKNHLWCSHMYQQIQRRSKKKLQEKSTGSVILKISDPAIYHRYFYTLIKFFSIEGYAIYYPECDLAHFNKIFYRRNTQPWNYFNLIFKEGLVLLGEMPTNKDFFELNDGNISRDYYFLNQERKEYSYRIPMTMHPLFYHLDYWKTPVKMNHKRKRSVFFSGNLSSGPYQNFKKEIFKQENRTEICHFLKEGSLYKEIEKVENLEEYIKSEEDFRVIMIDSVKSNINMPLLRPTLSSFNFFLALPGFLVPHCHNLIEALSSGTIPIIHKNYAAVMTPPLLNLENAIVFDDLEDLVEKIQYAFNLDDETILKMRKAVQFYYKTNLTPSSVIKKILSNKENSFYLQAEQNSLRQTL
ncbi:hypothetical protein JRG66_01760 [Salinimicrobium tongyeongense]|uniref:Uncharacterized protein n=1 Tax=Salinimicrobium tongyeongense TaxID=2809707 RepID=A0ABY6NRW0_9FLAO|nr:hypothetical protein [Salinimicrobium tongyeongense]UZH55645.1 hypothetical protein JRG66_01760 [Salinimicrobium tongyeongense]